MNYVQARNRVDSLNKYGSVLGLENIRELLLRLHNPQEKLKVIHVAGTNGKGSVIAYLSAILSEAGYKVGKYTSPVVFEYLEKYQIDNENISETDFVRVATKVMDKVDEMKNEKNSQPTLFEVETAMAFEIFLDKGCDIAIVETGMGGDMDATNVCESVIASVIVSISYDHTQILGNTLEEIAGHKAGIIKRKCPVIVTDQSRIVLDTVADFAKKKDAPVIVTKSAEYSRPFSYISYDGKEYHNINPNLKGQWQVKNACTAIETVEVMRNAGYNIADENVIHGINNAIWHGRFEMICEEPCIIIDGAHNPDAALMLRETIDRDYADTEFVYIMGVLGDKDYSSVIESMAGRAKKIYTVTPPNKRALDAGMLAKAVAKVNSSVEPAESITNALDKAIEEYDKMPGKRAILAFGSLSYLGMLTDEVKNRIGER